MHTEVYCPDLDKVSRVDLIRAVHEAKMQLAAISDPTTLQVDVDGRVFDNAPAIRSCVDCLRAAGHPGYRTTGDTPCP